MSPVCKLKDCDQPVVGRDLCRKHYMRQWRNGNVSDVRKNARGKCKVRGCDRPHVARGLCDSHYRSIRHKEQAARTRTGRECEFCSRPIPQGRKATAKYCSYDCKTKAHNAKVRSPEKARWYLIQRKYGITQAAYEDLLLFQGGRCAICYTSEPRGRGTWHVDHDHSTGDVRGLLCNGCNAALGQFKDDPKILRRAIEYLS